MSQSPKMAEEQEGAMGDAGPGAGLSIWLPLDRVRLWCIALGGIGTLSSWFLAGAGVAASFAIGAIASYFNFQLLHAVVLHLAPDPVPGRRQVLWLFVIRYGVLGLVGYATVRVFGVNPASFCIGLTVAAFAALLHSISELIYARA